MIDPISKEWSAFWYWSILGDSWYSPPDYWLESSAVTHNGIKYYRAHVAAANSVLSNPNWSTSRTILNASDTRRSAREVYKDILLGGRGIDNMITELTNGELILPGYGESFRSVF